jgi:hypothetical protein
MKKGEVRITRHEYENKICLKEGMPEIQNP